MANVKRILLSIILISLATLKISEAIKYTVTNKVADTSGGIRFKNEIGGDYTKRIMNMSTDFIWKIFQQDSEADRKIVEKITVFIEIMDGIASASNDEIHLSAAYIQGYSGDVKIEITGVLYHEMTYIWQWNGNGQANVGLLQGIADYVRLKAGYAVSYWAKPGQGDQWDQGYDITARFLDYCNSLKDGFVAKLNKKMRNSYSDNFFMEILGKTVDQLWSDYKAKYNN